MDYKELGKRIRAERNKLNLTQEKFAEKIEISESFLGHIERGNRKLSLETLLKISQELHVSVDYLLLGTVKQYPDVMLSEILHIIEKKNSKNTNILLNIIRLLVDNYEKWTE